jgi:hypothetical protein
MIAMIADGSTDECDRNDCDDCDESNEQSVLHHAGSLFFSYDPALEGRPQTKHVFPPIYKAIHKQSTASRPRT